MRTDTVLSQMKKIIEQFGERSAQTKIKREFGNSIVYLTYRKKTIYIESVEFDMSPVSTFNFQGKEITFAEYYNTQYGEDVDLKQPLLKHINKRNGKVEYYIPSLCLLTGISQDMRSNFTTMQKIASVTKKPPNDRIRETLNNQRECLEHSEFKLELDK
ncbi:predicted protein [Naegleria gruberi]|uniref:Predicted protein n=1 Tax=Naegleria gruberi TaxID=5762 RepID=D2V2M7_NAEGR|nr:uncharacterized protein NAEGRDRAFT_78309 [Naegleria gruberi]EFC49086.1 predicted protein [Naegleria gruberi]|eukprot:XP_002681830.1 predicted protein [Naegleria gruberi strain NEG-M]